MALAADELSRDDLCAILDINNFTLINMIFLKLNFNFSNCCLADRTIKFHETLSHIGSVIWRFYLCISYIISPPNVRSASKTEYIATHRVSHIMHLQTYANADVYDMNSNWHSEIMAKWHMAFKYSRLIDLFNKLNSAFRKWFIFLQIWICDKKNYHAAQMKSLFVFVFCLYFFFWYEYMRSEYGWVITSIIFIMDVNYKLMP